MIRARFTEPAEYGQSDTTGWLRRKFLAALFVFALAGILPGESQAASVLGVEFAEWGFDDRAVPRKFNLLTFEIQNQSGSPFEGSLRLQRLFSGSPTGAPLVQPVYIGPYQKRLVQFTPYVFDNSDEWELRWGNTLDDLYTVEAPRLGAGSRVIFNDPAQTSGLASGLRGFRDDRFPTSIIGTDTLLCVVLDHTPRWETARRRVFRDWLFRGGVLHVLRSPAGKFPELPVAELNTGKHPTRFGSGRIHWHESQRGLLHDNREFVYSKIYPSAPVVVRVADFQGADTTNVDPTSKEFTARLGTNSYMQTYSEWDSDQTIPFALRDFVQSQTRHNWPLIYVLAFAYLLLIFPGGPWLAKKLDYRLNLLGLIILVAAWSWFYAITGARGYGERSSTQSLAIARPLPDGRWDVEQWSGVFVTDGDTYSLTHSGESSHYSDLVKDGDRVKGYIDNGRDGRFVVDVPPFTSRTMAHRAVVAMPGPRVSVTGAEWSGGQLRKLSLRFDDEFSTPVQSAFVIMAGTIYSVDPKTLDGQATLTLTNPQPAEQLLNITPGNTYDYGYQQNRTASDEVAFARLLPIMLARDIGIRLYADRQTFRLPNDIVRLLLYTDLPEELSCRDTRAPDKPMGIQKGRVLYSIDLPVAPPEEVHQERDPIPNRPEDALRRLQAADDN